MDYVRPLSKLARFEAGYKGSLVRFHTTLDTKVFDDAQGLFQPDSARISDFTYRQFVNAAYSMLNAQHGSSCCKAASGWSAPRQKFHLRTSDATYDNPYSSVFPSALIAYNLDDAHQLKLSYSTRIRRPDETDLLDPTPRYTDPLNIFRGNPTSSPSTSARWSWDCSARKTT